MRNGLRSGRAVRVAAWASLGAVIAFGVLVPFIVQTRETAILLQNTFGYLLPILLTVVAGLVLCTTGRCRGVELRFWILLTAAASLLFVGETFWTYNAVWGTPTGTPITSPAILLYLAAIALFFFMAVTLSTTGGRSLAHRFGFYLDVAAGVVAFVPAVFLFWTYWAFEAVPDRAYSAAIAAVWVVFGLSMFTAMLAIVVGWKASPWRSWERMIVFSMMLYGLVMTTFPSWYPGVLSAGAAQPDLYTVGLGAGFHILFIGAVYRITADPSQQAVGWSPVRIGPPTASRYWPIAMCLVLVLIGYKAWLLTGQPEAPVVAGSAVVLGILLVTRGWFAELELAYHRRASLHDPHTTAYSSRYLHRTLSELLERDNRTELSLALIRIEDVGTQEGGACVSDAIRCAAALAGEHLGREHGVFRLGADELAVLYRGSADQVQVLVNDLASALSPLDRSYGGAIDLFVGLASHPTHAASATELVSRAREASLMSAGRVRSGVSVWSEHCPATVALGSLQGRQQSWRSREAVIQLADAFDRHASPGGHARAVARLAELVSVQIGLAEEDIEDVTLAAFVHDIGRVATAGSTPCLRRLPGAATCADTRDRVEAGVAILESLRLPEVANMVKHQYERWDGSGWPDGLSGTGIPLGSRILAACDVMHLLLIGDDHHPALPLSQAMEALAREAGASLDPEIVRVLGRVLSDGLLADEMLEPTLPAVVGRSA